MGSHSDASPLTNRQVKVTLCEQVVLVCSPLSSSRSLGDVHEALDRLQPERPQTGAHGHGVLAFL